MSLSLKRLLSILISFFLLTASLPCGIEEARASTTIPPSSLTFFPASLGTVAAEHIGAGDRLIVIIQDYHCHAPTQLSIAKILDWYRRQYGVQEVFLEGGVGTLDLGWLRNISDVKRRERITRCLVEQGDLTGAEYYGALSETPVTLRGIEDGKLYVSALSRLREVMEAGPGAESALKAMHEKARQLKQRHFNRRQKKLDRLAKAYRDDRISSEKYLSYLLGTAGTCGVPPGAFSSLEHHFDYLQSVKHLRYARVSKELRMLMDDLRKILAYREYKGIADCAGDSERQDELCLRLNNAIGAHALSGNVPSRYPRLYAWLRSNEARARLNPVMIVKQGKELERLALARLARTANQKDAAFLAGFPDLLDDFVNGRMTEDDYRYLAGNAERFAALWQLFAGSDALTGLMPFIEASGGLFRLNVARNEAFLRHVLAEGQTPGEKADIRIVVTGGFHTDGLTRLLEKDNISYRVITPATGSATEAAETNYRRRIMESNRVLVSATAPEVESGRKNEKEKNEKLDKAREAIKEEDGQPNKEKIAAILAGHRNLMAQQGPKRGEKPKNYPDIVSSIWDAKEKGLDALEIYADHMLEGMDDRDDALKRIGVLIAHEEEIREAARQARITLIIHTPAISMKDPESGLYRYPEPGKDKDVFNEWLTFGEKIRAVAVTVHMTDLSDSNSATINDFADYVIKAAELHIKVMIENTKFVLKEDEGKCVNDEQCYAVNSKFHTCEQFINGLKAIRKAIEDRSRNHPDVNYADVLQWLGVTFDVPKAVHAPDRTDPLKYLDRILEEDFSVDDIHLAQTDSEKYKKHPIYTSGAIDDMPGFLNGLAARGCRAWINQEIDGLDKIVSPSRDTAVGHMLDAVKEAGSNKIAAAKVRYDMVLALVFPEKPGDGDAMDAGNALDALAKVRKDLRGIVDLQGNFLTLAEPEQYHISVVSSREDMTEEIPKENEKDFDPRVSEAKSVIDSAIADAGLTDFAGSLRGTLLLTEDNAIILRIEDPGMVENIGRLRNAISGTWSKPEIVHITMGRLNSDGFTKEDLQKIKGVLNMHNHLGTTNVPLTIERFKLGIAPWGRPDRMIAEKIVKLLPSADQQAAADALKAIPGSFEEHNYHSLLAAS